MKKWLVIFSVAMMVTVSARIPAYPEEAQEETPGVSLPKRAEEPEITKKIAILGFFAQPHEKVYFRLRVLP